MSLDDAKAQRFPRVCVRTGEVATDTSKVDAYRTPAWSYLFLLAGLLPGLVVISLVRRRYPHVTLMLPVSPGIAARRRDRIALAVAATMGGLVLIVVGATFDSDVAVWFGIALSIVAIALTALALNVVGVSAQITRKEELVLSHVHDNFASALEGAKR